MRKFYAVNIIRFTFCILLVVVIWEAGCSTPKPVPNPLAGWKVVDYGYQPKEIKEIIETDYQNYIQTLPPEEQKVAGSIDLFKNGTGSYAVRILIPINGTWWAHVLIYDRENRRTNTIKYVSGHYRS